MTQVNKDYDPSIQGLLRECETDWGNPIVNRANLVPYGIDIIDQALYGIDVVNGELIVILGPQKQRKTTFAVNVLANIMTADKPVSKPFTVVDTLESGMPPKRYRDTLISVLASKWLIKRGHLPNTFCPQCNSAECKQLQLTPDFLRYMTRTKEQQEAILHAMDIMNGWPLHIYGANPYQGDTRNINSIRGKDTRWRKLIEEQGAKLFIDDHVQQYNVGTEATDYEKQLMAISAVSDVVAQWNVAVLMLSQVSLTSIREARSRADGKLTAAGGNKGAQEANVVFSVGYSPGSGRMYISIDESRKSGTFSLMQPLDDSSGAFHGKSYFPTHQEERE